MQAQGKNKPLWGFIAASVILHGVLLVVLGRNVNIGSTSRDKNEENKPLKARLVFVAPPTSVEAQSETEPQSDTEVNAQIENEEALPEPDALEDVAEVKAEAQPDITPEPAELEPTVESRPETLPETAPSPGPEPSTTEPQIITGTSTEKRYPVSSRELAQQHQGNIQHQLQQNLAEQSAQQHRQQQRSPIIRKPTPEPFMTEDEKLIESVKTRVDCSSTLNKSLAFISGLVAGTLDCSKPSDAAPYIQKRINKLPEGWQEQQEGPSQNQ